MIQMKLKLESIYILIRMKSYQHQSYIEITQTETCHVYTYMIIVESKRNT